jgi:perosamine synthetase
MTDIQAAVGLVQLDKLDAIVARRRVLASRYRERLVDVDGLAMISDPPDGLTNFQSFWIEIPEDFPLTRNELLAHLAEAGISARRGIMAAHLEGAYRDSRATAMPVTERVTRQSLILPMFHDMTEADQDRVVETLVGARSLGTR